MDQVKIFALGGLGENGKNMYCVEVGEEIVVLDVGFKYPDETMYGINTVVPDFTYLKANENKIKGLFLSHNHVDNIGAIDDFIRVFPKVKVYASSTTLLMVNYILEESNIKSKNLVEINKFDNIVFDNCSVFALPLTHSSPQHFGYAINTKQGIVFYATDYIFDQSATKNYSMDIGKIAYLGKQGVLCMLGESLNASKPGHTSPHHRISNLLMDYFEDAKRRAFVMVYSSNFYRIQEILTESMQVNRKVVVYGKRLGDIIYQGIENNIFDFDKKQLVSIFNVNKHQDEELTIIVSGEHDRPFSGMKRIVSGKDKYLKLSADDSVFIAAQPVPNTEIEATEVTDAIYKSGAHVKELSKKTTRGNHASKEDILMMLNLLNPTYFIPIKGEYRHQHAAKSAALSINYADENVLLLDNGQVAEFVDKKLKTISKVSVGDVLVDGNTISEGDVVLKDRELLKENGIVIVSCVLNLKQKQVIAGPEIVTRGFIYIKENKEYINELKAFCKEVIISAMDINSSYSDIQKSLRDNLSSYIYDAKGRKPMVLTMIQTV